MGERDFIALIDGVHHLVRAPIVLVWDRLNTHVSRRMWDLVAEREWLTVFLLPAYSPDLNPVEGVWAHVKRSLANLAVMALDRAKPSSATASNAFNTGPTPSTASLPAPASPSSPHGADVSPTISPAPHRLRDPHPPNGCYS